MAINKVKKDEIVADLHERLSRSKVAIMTDYKGLNVEAITKLRNELRNSGAEFQVAKNSLVKLAVKGTNLEGLEKYLQGPRAVALAYDDPVAPAKALVNFAKDNDKLEIIGGVLESKVITQDEIQNLAKLPSREELLASVLYAMNAVPTGLVQVLAAVPRNLLNALVAIRDKKEQE